MTVMLPDFDKLPSVLTYEEVEEQLSVIMNIAETKARPPIYMIQETINDGISALEYNPEGRFSAAIEHKVSKWAMSHWDWEKGDRNFIDGLTAIIINFSTASVCKQFFESKLKTETRKFAQEELEDVLKNDV
ncbi:hypothetical protein [Alteromonas lipotrueae]|uniref:hypothetical protein n=1 Tax=Alteromonas lipotrueae TaxID=2803814 RepID=UPI001C45B1C2|nr:hypothetical protein [Alteromonas lipotrueae]